MRTEERAQEQGARPGPVRRVRRWIGRHPVATGLGIATGTALVIFVLVWFQPQKLFIDERVNEAPPAAQAPPQTSAPSVAPTQAPAGPVTVAAGTFRSLAHKTKGKATLVTVADGTSYVRLESGFETENGPDLYVYLSPSNGSGDDDAIARNSLNLGRLRGNIGAQNYKIPAGTDLSRYNSVLIWCKRFSTGFGVASLTR